MTPKYDLRVSNFGWFYHPRGKGPHLHLEDLVVSHLHGFSPSNHQPPQKSKGGTPGGMIGTVEIFLNRYDIVKKMQVLV